MWTSLTVFNSTLRNGPDGKFHVMCFSPNKISICKSKHIHWFWLYILSIILTGNIIDLWPRNKIPEEADSSILSFLASLPPAYQPLQFTSLPISSQLPSPQGIKTWRHPWMGAENQENKDGGGNDEEHRRGEFEQEQRAALGHGHISPLYWFKGQQRSLGNTGFGSQTSFQILWLCDFKQSFLVFCWFVLAPKNLGFLISKELVTIHNSWCFNKDHISKHMMILAW